MRDLVEAAAGNHPEVGSRTRDTKKSLPGSPVLSIYQQSRFPRSVLLRFVLVVLF